MVNMFIRDPYRGRPGYLALALLLVVYAATLTVVIAPGHVLRALDAGSGSAWEKPGIGAGGFDD